jgi:carbamoyl-phosphate synthase/aspartate carbamoyltransferase/dihydroorotase
VADPGHIVSPGERAPVEGASLFGSGTLRLPGLIDVHVHTRDPGQTHKEDWSSATAAALAGGFTTVLAMPNTRPTVADEASLAAALEAARHGARCDYGQYAGATGDNAEAVAGLAPRVAGLKMYLNDTFGDLRLDDLDLWWRHLETWPPGRPLVVHAEGPAMATMILMGSYLERPVHICHLSRRDEILLIRRAKEHGAPVTCEATPHHLFLDSDITSGWGWRAEVRPRLATPADRAALWEHLEVIDCFATDHAPHTVEDKTGAAPPPGFPGLETALPLLLGAIHDGLMTIDDLVERLYTNPRRLFDLPAQDDTYVEIDPEQRWVVRPEAAQTRAGWTPFAGREMHGRVTRVVLRGSEVYRDGKVTGPPGSGRDIREREAS